jgi:hypothetical protein
VRDNIRISLVFTRLCAGMIIRLPFLLAFGIRESFGGKRGGEAAK